MKRVWHSETQKTTQKKTRMCILSIKTINKKAKDVKDTKATTIPEKKPVALLIYRKFSCVHTDRALPLTIKGGWEFSSSQSSAMRSQMVSASCGQKHEAWRGPNEVSTCLFEYIREQASEGVKKLKCSQTIAVDKTATGSLRLPYGMPESTLT